MMNNYRILQPRKVYFSLAQVAFKMKVDRAHLIDIINYFKMKPKIKKGHYKLITADIEIFYRIQLLRGWGHKDSEILSKKLYTDLAYTEIFNLKITDEKNKK